MRITRQKSRLKLYWVTTADHDEDWFIFARSKRLAERYHEEYEGYLRRDAVAERILTVPKSAQLTTKLDGIRVRHAQVEDLAVLGFEVLHTGDPNLRAVRYGSRVFVEGALQSSIDAFWDNLREASGQGRPRGTPGKLAA